MVFGLVRCSNDSAEYSFLCAQENLFNEAILVINAKNQTGSFGAFYYDLNYRNYGNWVELEMKYNDYEGNNFESKITLQKSTGILTNLSLSIKTQGAFPVAECSSRDLCLRPRAFL